MEPSRDELRRLLLEWKQGLKTERDVHEQAERLMAACEWKTLPRSDPRSIQYEVLCQLDILNQQLITVDDVEAFLQFLAAAIGDEERAWTNWDDYWNHLDMDARRRMLRMNPYYAAQE